MLHNNLNDAPELFFIPTGLPVPEEIPNGNILRNINSYEYLGYIAPNIPKELVDKIPSFKKMYDLYQTHPSYDPSFAYGNLYTQFLLDCERNILFINVQLGEYDIFLEKLKNTPEEKKSITSQLSGEIIKNKKQSLEQMLRLIYANPNQSLERSYQMIAPTIAKVASCEDIESTITKRLMEKPGGPSNYTTPQSEGSTLGRLAASFSRDFKPITTTSIPSIRVYKHQKIGLSPIEYRFGTQAQICMREPEINPLFSAWIDLQQNPLMPNQITHIYFNNLAFTNPDLSIKRECDLSATLHSLKHKNLAVITLPSYMSLINLKRLINYDQAMEEEYDDAKKTMLNIATSRESKPLEDFCISDRIKKLLYGEGDPYDRQTENETIDYLLERSFNVMGIPPFSKVNQSQKQAIFFHFIKFELTNFIIEKLQPNSFNMSCKDAIDRGGVSSAYYNLLKSLEKDAPMSEEEFLCGLHGAPTLVKGRGMNFHIKIIWNAVDHLIQAHDKIIKERGTLPITEIPGWLRTWRDDNAVTHSKTHYAQKLTQYMHQRSVQSQYLSIIGQLTQMDLIIKIAVANKLVVLLEENRSTSFSNKEWLTLKNGRLGKLFAGLQSHKILPPPDPQPKEDSSLTHHQ